MSTLYTLYNHFIVHKPGVKLKRLSELGEILSEPEEECVGRF